MPSEVFMVVARAQNGTIGKDNSLPWHLPADLKHFKSLTMGSAMVMGRKTFDSLPGLLPGRRHLILTRNRDFTAPGAEVVHSITEALSAVSDGPLSVIGGAEVFALFMDHARRIELTEVLEDYDGDVAMPDPRLTGPWLETHRENFTAADGKPAYRFITLKRAAI